MGAPRILGEAPDAWIRSCPVDSLQIHAAGSEATFSFWQTFLQNYAEAIAAIQSFVEALAAALLPALLLGRIDGKSPIEYVSEEREKNQVRDFARRYIATRVDRLDVIRDAWAQQVHA